MDIVFLGRILVCFILSFIIGLERQWRRRNIGLRTNVLVSIGSFLFVMISVKLTNVTDSTRIAAQVVSGIGFLGAGVILKDGTHIRGLNTAATLWCNAAIGVLCAYGFLWEAIIGTIFILTCNILLRKISIKMMDDYAKNDSGYEITIVCREKYKSYYKNLVVNFSEKSNLLLQSSNFSEVEENNIKLKYYISSRNVDAIEKMMQKLSVEENIVSASFKMVSEDYKKAIEADEV